MYHEIVKKLRAEFDGRPPSDQLDWEVRQRLRELSPNRSLCAVWGRGRIMGVCDDVQGALDQAALAPPPEPDPKSVESWRTRARAAEAKLAKVRAVLDDIRVPRIQIRSAIRAILDGES